MKFKASSGNICEPVIRSAGDRVHILASWDQDPSSKDIEEFDDFVRLSNKVVVSKRSNPREAIREGDAFLKHEDN
jgi:hypothetical protein